MRIAKKCSIVGAAIFLIGGVAACDDDLGLNAFVVEEPIDVTVYALNGTAQSLPAGLDLKRRQAAQVNLNWAFDLAFDLNASNEVVVYTVRAVSSELVNLPRVGIQTSTLGFDEILNAPGSGFVYDSLLTLPIGTPLIVDKVDPSCNQFGGVFLGFNIRGKLMVDSISTSRRAIYLTVLSNPNCGYRSLKPGEPKD